MRRASPRTRPERAVPALADHGSASERAADAAADRVIAGRVAAHETHAAPAQGTDEMRPARARAAAVTRQAGAPLPASEKRYFEARFGRDLSAIRLHSDAAAGDAARGIGASAFALGNHIGFAPRAYAPETPAGRHLLGHEIAHSLQQSTLARPVIQRQAPKMNPEIANLPWERHLDAFKEAHYDLDYRAEGGNLSTWLTLVYHDDAQIDLPLADIEDRDAPYLESWAEGHVGTMGRVFPKNLTRTTCPKLWGAKQEAIAVMEEYNYEFMLATLPAVLFIIFSAGLPATAGKPVMRRTTRPRPRIRAPAPKVTPKTTTPDPKAGAPAAAAGASSFKLAGSKVLRYGGRDIVVVETSAGRQAFYRRTGMGGTNAGGAQKGNWAPFDGVLAGWFDKARYATGSADDVLYRFGTEENRRISEWLATQAIRAGDDVGEVFSIVNQYLKDLGALKSAGMP